MRFFYTLVIYLLLPFIILRLFFLSRKNPAYGTRWRERFGFLSRQISARPTIWIHAVSVGEVNASKPLVRYILAHYKNYRVLITTVTPTGALMVRRHFSNDVVHHYFPYDLTFAIKRFLKTVRPVMFMTMETELWPNLFNICKAARIPILIINARLSEKSVGGYQRISALTREMLFSVSAIAAQTREDADRFIRLGASKDRVFVTGNLKFDVSISPESHARAESLRRYFSSSRPIWIAASTRSGEEEMILNAHKAILKNNQDAILILAPRHPERVDEVAEICKKNHLEYVRRTEKKALTATHSVYLLDTLGELQSHYMISQVAFVGGSLVNTGGQNMIEAASLGLPIICGHYTYNFAEMMTLLSGKDAVKIVADAEELSGRVCDFFADADMRQEVGEKARSVVNANKGSLAKVVKLLSPYLSGDTFRQD